MDYIYWFFLIVMINISIYIYMIIYIHNIDNQIIRNNLEISLVWLGWGIKYLRSHVVWWLDLFQWYLLYSHIHIHYRYTNICGNIVNNNDDFNEQTNTLLYKNITLTLYSRKGDVSCVWEVSWRRTDCYILTPSSFDHSSTSFAFWLGCSTVGHWEPKLSVWSWFSSAGILSSLGWLCKLIWH